MNNIFLYNGDKKNFSFEIMPNKNEPESDVSLEKVSKSLNLNVQYLENLFCMPYNGDIVFRNFSLTADKKYKSLLVCVDGLSDGNSINDFILKPLMMLKTEDFANNEKVEDVIEKSMLPQGQITVTEDICDAAQKVNIGNALLIVDGISKCFVIDVKSWEHRGVDNPENEAVIQGPHEGFNEVLRCNTALIRKTLNTSNLVMENVFLGKTSKTPGAVAYLKNVANSHLVNEVKRRLKNIDAEYILSSLDAEQYIEEASFLPVPQMITTERPDRVCNALTEGRVAVIMNGSSHVLIMPATFFDLITSAEDEYLRYPYSLLIRFLRYAAAVTAMLLPAVFVSIVNYHRELLFTNLMYAVASSRSLVPFGTVTELLLMEFAFELIKEAGVRVPGPIGSTIGIVGGLIVGQAAVDANLASPIMIIIVALTGIASFTIPSYSLSFAFRFSRFLYIIGAAVGGFLGLGVVFFVNTLAAVGTKSFGVPFMAPLGSSNRKENGSLIFGAPIWIRGTRRENYLKPRDEFKKAKISRKWLWRDKN